MYNQYECHETSLKPITANQVLVLCFTILMSVRHDISIFVRHNTSGTSHSSEPRCWYDNLALHCVTLRRIYIINLKLSMLQDIAPLLT